jgi:hypothetical protein
MALSDFYAKISRAVKRGTSQDELIPDWAESATNMVEQNYSYLYMRRVGQLIVDLDAEAPERLELNGRVKSIEHARLVNGGTLEHVDPALVTLTDGTPVGYWLDGDDFLVLDAVPRDATTVEIIYYEYTSWPSDVNVTPALLMKYQNLLRAATLVQAGRELPDPALLSTFSPMLEEALTLSISADREARQLNRDYRKGPR